MVDRLFPLRAFILPQVFLIIDQRKYQWSLPITVVVHDSQSISTCRHSNSISTLGLSIARHPWRLNAIFKARLLPQKKQRADERFAMGEKARFPRLAVRKPNPYFASIAGHGQLWHCHSKAWFLEHFTESMAWSCCKHESFWHARVVSNVSVYGKTWWKGAESLWEARSSPLCTLEQHILNCLASMTRGSCARSGERMRGNSAWKCSTLSTAEGSA